MLESQEDIDLTLSIAGEKLFFSIGDILGIPGQEVYTIPGYDSPYDVKRQDISFQISKYDYKNSFLTEGDSFTYNLLGEEYTFIIVSFIDDYTGWIEMLVKLDTVEDV